ncbi:hypothetical protein N0V95_009910 [Ascochyta clinopodiicola]|nr:hypothetical protein N0V95_009910 [Ascochyta clinopodiicola]
MSDAPVATAGSIDSGTVSRLLQLPPELRLLIYNNVASDVERLLPLDKVFIYYHDVDPAILQCCKLVRREARTLLRRLRLDIPPTLILTLDLPKTPMIIDTPNTRSLSAIVRMLLGGYHYWLENWSSASIGNVPMGFCDFFRRFEQPLSLMQSEDYIITNQKELEAFYSRTLHQMLRARSLTVLLRLGTGGGKQTRSEGIIHLLPLGGTFGPYDPRILSLDVILLVNALRTSIFESTVPLSADGPIRPLFRVQPLVVIDDRHEADAA